MLDTKIEKVVLLLTILIPNSLQLVAFCTYKISPGWKVVGLPADQDPYGCFMTSLYLQRKLDISAISGRHSNGYSNVNVKALSIDGGVCQIIPSGLGTLYPNIEAFSVRNATLKTVSSEDLQQFPNAREIWLYSNKLEVLPSNLFEHNPKVEYISFNSNLIKSIGENFFDYLPKLKQAGFFYNVCISDGGAQAEKLEVVKNEIKRKCP